MAGTRDGVPDEQGQAQDEDDRRHRSEEQPDPQQSLGCLRGIGNVTEQFQGPAADRDPERSGEFTQESPHAVINAFAALTRLKLVVFHHVGDHAPGEDPLTGKSNPGYDGGNVDERAGRVGVKECGDHRQAGNEQPDGIRDPFTDLVGDCLPGEQENPNEHEHQHHHQGQLGFHVQLVDQVIREQGGEEGETEAAQELGSHQLHKRFVLEGLQDGF